jgi:hypothetical protein|tara:strand:+ start:74 stop:265 length:192 start_codon:yes stop_codon:yes gene_type:complete
MDLQKVQKEQTEQNNTIDSIQITGAEYVIIKNLEKEYQLIKTKLIDEIIEEIIKESNAKILKK